MRPAFRPVSLLLQLLVPLLLLGQPASAESGLPFWIEKVDSNGYYHIEQARIFGFLYSDREYVLREIPDCLKSAHILITANSDKFSRGGPLIVLYSEEPLRVYLGHDERYRDKPDWLLKQFRPVRARIVSSDPKLGTSEVTYQVYTRDFPPGPVELGGNMAAPDRSNFSMYTVFLVPTKEDSCRF